MLIFFQLLTSIGLVRAERTPRTTSIHDAFEHTLPHRNGLGNLRRTTSNRSRLLAATDEGYIGYILDSKDDKVDTTLPPEIKRDESNVCYAGNYHTPELRQAEGSTEPLVDPPKAVPDLFGWMRDETREDPIVLDHLMTENNWTQKVMAPMENLQQELYDELVSSIQETDYSTPRLIKANGQYVYYSRTNEGSGYRIYCRAPVPAGDLLEEGEITAELINWDGKAETPILPGEEVYLDGNDVASGHEYSDIGAVSISPSEHYVAYTVDNIGNEEYTLIIKDLTTGTIVRDYGENTGPGIITGNIMWSNDDSSLYLLKNDDEWRPYQVYQFSDDLGQEETTTTNQNAMKLLFEEQNQLFWVYAWKSADRKYLFVGGFAGETSYVHFIALGDQHSLEQDNDQTQQEPPTLPLVAEKRDGVYYDVEHHNGHWLLLSNERDGEKTPNFRLLTSPAVPDSADMWVDFKDENDEVLFDGSEGDRSFTWFNSFSNHIALEGREGGIPRVWVLDMKKNFDLSESMADERSSDPSAITLSVAKTTLVTFEEEAHDVSVSGNPLYDIDRVRVQYSSLTTPRQTRSVDMNDPTSFIVIDEQFVPNYDKSLYNSHRAFVNGRDGTQIPYSLVFRSDLVGSIMDDDMPNDHPVLLYGYGSYGSSIDHDFSASLLPLLDRGVVFVQANVRGGGEMGREWYESAKYLNKKRTFEDFVDVARYLVGQDGGDGKGKITSPEKLAIRGASAGGLLVGASMNEAPELFRVAILDVPFVDVVCTMTDSSIPLTVGEWEEWGNPNEAKYFEYMLSYSPVNNIRNDAIYPSTLVLGGLHDTRVQYWEPAKFAATLRYNVGQTYTKEQMEERPILLKTDLDAGHSSASDRYKSYRERAIWHSFLLDQLGIANPQTHETDDTGSTSSATGFGAALLASLLHLIVINMVTMFA